MEVAHSFRLQQKNILNAGTKKKQTLAKEVEKPTKASAWVAQTFPTWQTTILETMKELYTVCTFYLFIIHNFLKKKNFFLILLYDVLKSIIFFLCAGK